MKRPRLKWLAPLLALLFLVRPARSTNETDIETAGLPRFELGLLGGAASLPDYPASDQNHPQWLALPYAVYRGEILRADREGARARLLRTRLFDVEMSFAGSFPARSNDNAARRGMPDLDWMGEIGPRLSIPIVAFPRNRGQIKLFVPIRGVFSTSFQNFHRRGWVFAPALYTRYLLWSPEHLWISQAQATFGSRPLNAYFYDVPAAYATPDRTFYDARAGYVGTQLFSGFVIPLHGRTFRFFGGGLMNLHQKSANAESPLFRQEVNYGVIGGVTWSFYESTSRAAVRSAD